MVRILLYTKELEAHGEREGRKWTFSLVKCCSSGSGALAERLVECDVRECK